jgi:hypothetical protein
MAGLDPAIDVFADCASEVVDARDKRGHDGVGIPPNDARDLILVVDEII